MSTQRHGCLVDLFKLLLLCVVVVCGVASLTSPWAFHIGGRWTPLLYWSGYGKLVTRTGTYPLYVVFYPSADFSKRHVDGLNPTGGLQGTNRASRRHIHNSWLRQLCRSNLSVSVTRLDKSDERRIVI